MAAAMASSAGPSVPLAGPSNPAPPLNPPPPVPIHLTPARSILKQPPPPPKPFFSLSTFSKLLPSQNAPPPAPVGAGENIRKTPLKRAHFVLPHLSTTYPIWSGNPPATGDTQEEKRSVEEKERERRIRVVRGNSLSSAAASPGLNEEWGWWSAEKVEQFYRECCWGRDEVVNVQISTAIRQASIAPRSLDLTGVQLTSFAAAAFADILNVEWGLRKLVLKDCQLDDLGLKPILHSLLLPNSLSFLSIAANKNLKANAWRLVGVYLGKAAALQFLDVSQNPLDKRAVEHLVVSLGTLPPTVPSQQPGWATPTSGISSLLKDKDTQHGLVSLRMDDCQLKPQALEALAHAVRSSPLRNISLRANRIAPSGAVAIALMIKDYPDTVPVPNGQNTPLSPTSGYLNIPFSPPGSYSNSPSHSPLVGPTELPHPNSPGFLDKLQEAATAAANKPLPPSALAGASTSGATTAAPQKSAFALRLEQTARSSIAGPTPALSRTTASVNTSTASGTTYTPYIPRSKRSLAGSVGPQTPPVNGASAGAKADGDFQLITSSVGGGVTMRHHPGQGSVTTPTQGNGGLPSAALLDKVRALDLLPRLGALRTLDLRGNDIRTGVTYISQVLKRNRTLKVLNLADNKIAVDGLVAIAEALKYNSSLETLDMSRNPCCGPGLEGVTSLRTAFTLNTSLKRLFLSSTGLLSPGAIMLAEFLPESTSLLHLDLTQNWGLDMAGVMALSVGLKANEIMRCLDLNIPAGDEEMARLCRDILGSCVRNTEKAEAKGGMKREGTGVGRGVWGMIEDSALARGVREGDVSGVKDKDDVIPNARIIQVQLENYLARAASSSSPTASPLSPSHSWSSLSSASSSSPATAPATPGAAASPELANLLKRANTILPSLVALIERSSQQTGTNALQLEELLTLNDALTNLVAKAKEIAKPVGLGIVIPNGAGSGSSGGGYFAEGSGSPGIPSVSEEPDELDELEDETPTTPRVDKGKGKARELELEIDVGGVNGESRLIPEPASAGLPPGPPGNQHLGVPGEGEGEHQLGSPSATTAVSRSWVEEEGEIFRKGVVLLGPDEMEGEFAGDELRRELLEAQVERPPQRVLDGDEELMIDVDTLGPPPPSINPQTAAAIHNPTGSGSPRSPRSPASMASSPRTPDGGRGLPPTTAFAPRAGTREGRANSLGLSSAGGASGSPTVAVSRVRAGSSSSVPSSQHQQQ